METMHGKNPDGDAWDREDKVQVAPSNRGKANDDNSSHQGAAPENTNLISDKSTKTISTPTKKLTDSSNIGKITSEYLAKGSGNEIDAFNNDIRNDIPRQSNPGNGPLPEKLPAEEVVASQDTVSMVTVVNHSTMEAERLKVPLWAKETSSQAAVFLKVKNSTRGKFYIQYI